MISATPEEKKMKFHRPHQNNISEGHPLAGQCIGVFIRTRPIMSKIGPITTNPNPRVRSVFLSATGNDETHIHSAYGI